MNSLTDNSVDSAVVVDLATFKKILESCEDEIIRYALLLKNAADQLTKYTDEYVYGNISAVICMANVTQIANLLNVCKPTVDLSEEVTLKELDDEDITSDKMLLDYENTLFKKLYYGIYQMDIYCLDELCCDAASMLFDGIYECADDIYEYKFDHNFITSVLDAKCEILRRLYMYTNKYNFVCKQFDIIEQFSELPFHHLTK